MKFKSEWTKEDFSKVQKEIRKHFAHKSVTLHNGKRVTFGNTFKAIDQVLGLAYTSSSSYAMFGVCNVQAIHGTSVYHYSHFAMTETGKVFAVLNDKWEKELLIELPCKFGKVQTIDVNAKEWRDKVNGNSYVSSIVIVNFGMKDEREYRAPFEYGYGDFYLQQSFALLADVGEWEKTSESPTYLCRERGIICRYNKVTGCSKADVRQWGGTK